MPQIEAFGLSHGGRSRSTNQDAYLVRAELGFFAVADGMGGRPAGEVAARMAIDVVLERMRDKREKILKNPEAYRQEQIEARLPDEFEDLPEEEQNEITAALEGVVPTVDPAALRADIQELGRLIARAKLLEQREIESKLVKLKKVLGEHDIFENHAMKLLVFTEHKDTLDYLAGDGKDGRPLGKLRAWGLKTTQIHGGMKIGDRDTPGTRIYAEREFNRRRPRRYGEPAALRGAGRSARRPLHPPAHVPARSRPRAGRHQGPDDGALPGRTQVEHALVDRALNPFLAEVGAERKREVDVIARHLEISLGELIHRANLTLAELENRRIQGESVAGLECSHGGRKKGSARRCVPESKLVDRPARPRALRGAGTLRTCRKCIGKGRSLRAPRRRRRRDPRSSVSRVGPIATQAGTIWEQRRCSRSIASWSARSTAITSRS